MSMTDDDDVTGAISTEDDNSGAAPVSPQTTGAGAIETPVEDDSGTSPPAPAAQSPQGAPPQTDQSRSGVDFNAAHVPGNMKKIISYLMGADAAHPQTIDQVGQQVDPEGKMPAGDRNLLAIDHVRNTQGDNAAWQLLQANRVAYNAQTAFAQTALKGTPQKPADVNSAIDAANKAQANVLDGSNVQFAADRSGVTATVNLPGSAQPQQIKLSPQGFAKWLDVGGDGQWDKVVEHSAPATLQRLAQQYPPQQTGMATVGPRGQPLKAQPSAPIPSQQTAPTAQAPAPALEPDSRRTGGAPMANETNYGAELEARSRSIYPDVGHEAERQQWMAAQEEKDLNRQNQIEVAKEKGVQANNRAETAGGWRYKAADRTAAGKETSAGIYSNARIEQAAARLKAASAHEDAVNARSDKANAMRGLVGLINTGNLDKMNPAQKQMFESMSGGTPQQGAPQQAAPQRQAPQQSAASPQDQQALAWARANADDPKAALILKKLGVQ